MLRRHYHSSCIIAFCIAILGIVLFFFAETASAGNTITVTRGHQPLYIGWVISGGFDTSQQCSTRTTNVTPVALATAWINAANSLYGNQTLPKPTDIGSFWFRCTHASGASDFATLVVTDCPGGQVWSSVPASCVIAPALTDANTPSCTIAANASSCGATASWSISNGISPSIRQNGTQISTDQSNAGTAVTLQHGTPASNVFTYYDIVTGGAMGQLGTRTGSASCIAGTTWTGSVCAYPVQALSIVKVGTGAGTITSAPAGINCGATCSASYTYDTEVTLAASPSAGSSFAGWSGTADCADGIVTMNAAVSCTATFTDTPPTIGNVTISSLSINPNNSTQYTITVSGSDPGGVTNMFNEYVLINYQGSNGGNYRGYLTWAVPDYWPTYQDHRVCNLGYAVVQPGYGNSFIHLDSCSVADSGNTRTVSFVVRFEPIFTTPLTNNDISGIVYDILGQYNVGNPPSCLSSTDWCNFDLNFGLLLPDLSALNTAPVANTTFLTIDNLTFTGSANNSNLKSLIEGGWADVEVDWHSDGGLLGSFGNTFDNNYNAFSGAQLGAFAINQSKVLSYTIPGPLTSGVHRYRFNVDVTDSLTESNETNNRSQWVSFTVRKPRCSDTTDNDGDGAIDALDTGCGGASYDPNDDDEFLPPGGNITASTPLVYGQKSKLNWNTNDTTGCTVTVNGTYDASNGAPLAGTSVEPTISGIASTTDRDSAVLLGNTTYVLACGATLIGSASIIVNNTPTLTTPDTLVDSGDPIQLTWNLSGLNNCTLSGGQLATMNLSTNAASTTQITGTTPNTPVYDEYTYTLNCGTGKTASVTVKVTGTITET